MTPTTMKYIRDFSTLLAVLINILMLLFKKLDERMRNVVFDPTVNRVCDVISIIQLTASVIVIIIYIVSKGKLIIHKRWGQRVHENRN